MKTRICFLGLSIFALAACGAPPEGALDGGSSSVTCQFSATSPARGATSGSITAKGTITCTGPASVTVNACLDYRSSSTAAWSEAVCQSSTQSGVSVAEVSASTGCLNSSRDYRLRVSGSANSQTITAIESSVAIMPSCQ